ncbi:CD59 glycoprotein [Ictalurus furcatus]|uniref:CD59 glycoprotein n=1 Tax=Ictalurus furcatus TaxID=66913 RepID=UPI002350D608|nr:CD59 glycoprotein [Ictalurus furcatus]
MKTLVLTLFLALMLMSGSALKCNYCISRNGVRCTTTTETCSYKQDACVSAFFVLPTSSSYFRRCISMADCSLLQVSSSIRARCCQTDLCN